MADLGGTEIDDEDTVDTQPPQTPILTRMGEQATAVSDDGAGVPRSRHSTQCESTVSTGINTTLLEDDEGSPVN